MRSGRVLVVLGAALAVVALAAAAVLAATPKDGTFAGKTDTSGQKITIKVTKDGKKAKVSYCNYDMGSKVKHGKFDAAHNGPGGVYVAVEGKFATKKTAKGEVTTDFLCDSEGETFKAKLK